MYDDRLCCTCADCGEDCDISEWTGLKDRNDNEIYEWDIDPIFGVCLWIEDDCGFGWKCLEYGEIHEIDYLTSEYEVIGNVYENPELIKEI